MGWEDRDYSKDGRRPGWSSGGIGRAFWWLLTGSVPLFTAFRIRVRIHAVFLVFLILQLVTSSDPSWTLRWSTLLFCSVLLHEFGHCFGCRLVGGQADEILMWPLGGLAMCAPPRRVWPEFVTVAGGPAVTLILALVPYIYLLSKFGTDSPVSLDPFNMWQAGWWVSGVDGFLSDLYLVNYTLLLFNLLLVFYPFDGGRLVQVALWWKFGYDRSMRWALAIGMAGAGGVAAFGLVKGTFLLIFIGAFGFYTCYRQNQALSAGMLQEEVTYDPGYYNALEKQSRGSVRSDKRREKQRRKQADTDAEVDRILTKVQAQGLQSLTRGEKKTLNRETEKKRRAS